MELDQNPGDGKQALAETIRQRLLDSTPSLLPQVEQLAIAAAHDLTVLLTGEPSTGKTFLARLIHYCSSRKNGPLTVVSCGALALNLIESELFGHVKGAFTGATENRIGKFALAGAGTLLLEEVDTLGLEQQAKLLRVVESGYYDPVGCHETQVCRARLIVASNVDLESATAAGEFREDLWYRLNDVSLCLPPLRERTPDVAPLARKLVVGYARKFHKQAPELDAEA